MSKRFVIFRSFRWKLTLVLVILMCFAAGLSDFLIYEYSSRSQFSQLRDKLKIIAQAIALNIDADNLLAIPLDRSGMETPQYKAVEQKLLKIKKIAPSLVYIYILKKTDREGILRFMIDVRPVDAAAKIQPAAPGNGYDASGFPQLFDGFNAPSADDKLVTDRWGVFLSGYAPVRDSEGRAVAVLGIDMSAEEVYAMRNGIKIRALLVMALGFLLALALGFIISARITSRIRILREGTRHIASGDLDYRVKISGSDEISALAGAFNTMAANLGEARKKLVSYFYHAVQSLVRVMEARDLYTKGHSDRVADYSVKIARAMKLPEGKIALIGEAALLHDIGKLGVQEMILNKTSALTEDERAVITRHPGIGEEILKPLSPDTEFLRAIRGHHERYDGKGYPDGLKGQDIGILASIICAADSYDAMISHRLYRKDLTEEEAQRQLEMNKGTQFNPEVVDAFLRVLRGGAK